MNVRCECGKQYQVHDRMIGKSVRCQQCSRTFVVPGPTAAPRAVNVPTENVAGAIQASTAAVAPRAPGAGAQINPLSSGSGNASDAKARAERERQIIAQYVQYKPKPGDKLRGAALAKVEHRAARRERLGGALKMIFLGIGLVIGAVFGYYKLAAAEAAGQNAQDVHWIMSLLNSIGGKWTAAIGLGLIAAFCIGYGILFWLGVAGRSKKV